MLHLDLFSGIGGFALAADAVWPNTEHVFCEIDPFCQTVLKKHWPNSIIYGDIRTLTNTNLFRQSGEDALRERSISAWRSGKSVDLITGGFPCQPFSHAGKRKGTSDDRHLWPEMRRVIQEFSPTYVVAENVRGLLSIEGGMVFEQVCLDLEALGYEVQPFVIPACAVNAPHRRDRVWIVAHVTSEQAYATKSGRLYAQSRLQDSNAPDAESARQWPEQALSRTRKESRSDDSSCSWSEDWPQVAACLCTLDDGLPDGLVRPRGWRNAALKAAGNAIVPQVAEQIFRVIKEVCIYS
jgi:DNA (cytosine-5)-methyltransferase 1